MRKRKELLKYEKMNPTQLDESIKKLEKKSTVYFIGFCTFFVMAFFYSMSFHSFFTVLIGFIFMGILVVYCMIAFTFVRLVRILQFNDNFMADMLNTDEKPKTYETSIKDREEIPELK